MRAHSASQPLSGEGPEEVRRKGAWAGERDREGLQVQGDVGTGALSVAPGATHPGPHFPFTKGIPWKSKTHPLPGHLLLKVTACPVDVDPGAPERRAWQVGRVPVPGWDLPTQLPEHSCPSRSILLAPGKGILWLAHPHPACRLGQHNSELNISWRHHKEGSYLER